jgi:polysaccharide export outer membrane protein
MKQKNLAFRLSSKTNDSVHIFKNKLSGKSFFSIKNAIVVSVLVVILSSCASKKDIYYLQNQDGIVGGVNLKMPKIQVNDILNIKVTAENLEAASIFNTSSITGGGGGGALNAEILKITGYLVGEHGEINFPVLGTIKVVDMTIEELEKYIIKEIQLRNFLENPVVTARVINAKVTISGEVRSPGTYTFTEQVLTLPQALGYAGDLTINGKRNNILLIREENGERTYTTIDLTKSDFFNSPYYYIKQNDWIYVYPNAPKVASSGFVGNVGTVLGLGSFVLTITILLTR